MGYKSTLRSIGAAVRQAEREAVRQQRDLEKRRAQYEKMQELEQAELEVDEYENYLDRILTLHKDCESDFTWDEIAKYAPPIEPIDPKIHEKQARDKLDKYKPNIFSKLLKHDIRKRNKLTKRLSEAIHMDRNEFNETMRKYSEKLVDYNNLMNMANNLINGNLEYYNRAINEFDPLSEITEIGSEIEYYYHSKDKIKVTIHTHDNKVIPKQAKSLLKSGKLTIKDIPQSKYNEMYQDYVCSASIRTAREIFGLLPVDEIIITAKSALLNTVNGRLEAKPILSTKYIRDTMKTINFEEIDPSDCMNNFVHNMSFKKSLGMSEVAELE